MAPAEEPLLSNVSFCLSVLQDIKLRSFLNGGWTSSGGTCCLTGARGGRFRISRSDGDLTKAPVLKAFVSIFGQSHDLPGP